MTEPLDRPDLLKEPRESRYDVVANSSDENAELGPNAPSGGNLIESYIRNEFDWHIHFRVRRRGFVDDVADLCAVFQCDTSILMNVGNFNVTETPDDAPEDGMERPVLINIGPPINEIERMPLGQVECRFSGALAGRGGQVSVVWLQPLNLCECVGWYDPMNVLRRTREVKAVSRDREAETARLGRFGLARMGDGEGIDEVIQRRTEVVEAVSDEDADSERRRIGDIEEERVSQLIVVSLDPNRLFVTIEKCDHFRVDQVEHFFCAVELGPNPSQRLTAVGVTHAKETYRRGDAKDGDGLRNPRPHQGRRDVGSGEGRAEELTYGPLERRSVRNIAGCGDDRIPTSLR